LLLRLERGQRAGFSEAARACGLSGAGLAQLYLAPFCAALSAERVAKLAALMAGRRAGLATVLGRLIDEAEIRHGELAPADERIAVEFDQLFDPPL